MSYVRFNEEESDVYVFLSYTGWLECCGCRMRDRNHFVVRETGQMLDHLKRHRERGDVVPQKCIDRLLEDAAENDEWIRAYATGEVAE